MRQSRSNTSTKTKKELQFILQEGEGYLIEFKDRLTHLDREMVSFANGAGGRIFLGVSDKGNVQGIKITNTLKSQIQDIANNCDPPVHIRMETRDNILVIHVRPGEDKPYSCSGGFYLRIGPNAQKIIAILQDKYYRRKETIYGKKLL